MYEHFNFKVHNYKNFKNFYSKVKAILQKIVLRYYFPQSS
jgi:hypothetical protein